MDQLTFDSPDRPTAPLWSAGPRRRSSRLNETEGRPVEVVEARRAQPPTMHGHHLPLCKASLCVPLMQQHAPRALLGLCSARGRRCPQRCSPNFGRAAYAPHIDVCTRRCDPGSSPGRAEPPRSQASVGEQPLLGPRRGSPTVEARRPSRLADRRGSSMVRGRRSCRPCPRHDCPHSPALLYPCLGRRPHTLTLTGPHPRPWQVDRRGRPSGCLSSSSSAATAPALALTWAQAHNGATRVRAPGALSHPARKRAWGSNLFSVLVAEAASSRLHRRGCIVEAAPAARYTAAALAALALATIALTPQPCPGCRRPHYCCPHTLALALVTQDP